MRKRTVIIPLSFAFILVVSLVSFYTLQRSPEKPRAATSTHEKVSLEKPILSLKNGQELAGSYNKAKDQALFYTVSHNKKILASGSILPNKDGSFSRNIAFDTKPKKGTPLTLKLLVQNTKGDIVDELKVNTKYQ